MQPAPRSVRPLRAQSGMTLLEIMIVLAIIALVMGFLVGPAVYKRFAESKVSTAHAIAKKFHYEAFTQWATQNPGKSCPDDIKELTKYMNSEDVNDPWGNPFQMACGGSAPEGAGGFGVVSNGEDGKPGTPDDIKSWQPAPKS